MSLRSPRKSRSRQYVADGGLAALVSPDGVSSAGVLFTDLLTQPGDACATVRRMQRTTLLRALLPELERCMGLIPYDSSHAHTVGEHSIRVLGNLLYLRDTVPDGDPPTWRLPLDFREPRLTASAFPRRAPARCGKTVDTSPIGRACGTRGNRRRADSGNLQAPRLCRECHRASRVSDAQSPFAGPYFSAP